MDTIQRETLTKKRGRPPKQRAAEPRNAPISGAETPFPEVEVENESVSRVGVEPWPPLPSTKLSGHGIMDYWNALTSSQRQFGNIYLYRLHPKMMLESWRGAMVTANCEKFSDEDGPLSRDVIWKRRRIGIYLLRLVQRVTKPYGQIAKAELELRDEWTQDNMPILDLEKLDRTDPSNKEYVRILKLRGIIKVDGGEEGEDEMAASQVLGDIASKAMEKLGNQPQQAQQVQGTTDLAGVVGPIIGLLDKQINQNRPPEQQGTVGDHVKSLVDLARSMAPAPVDLTPFINLQQQNNALVEKMMQKDVDRAEAEARKAREEAETYKAAMPRPKSLREELREMRELQQEYKSVISGKDEEDEDDKPEPVATAGLLGTIVGSLPILERILAHGANMLYNWKLNGGGAVPLNPGTAQPGNQPLPPQPAATVAEAEPEPSAEEQQRIEHMQDVVNQLAALEKPMLKFFLDPTKTGRDFAKFTLENFGQDCFATVGSVGKQALINMLSQYPPVWDVVGPKIQEFAKFLDEFLTYQAAAVQ